MSDIANIINPINEINNSEEIATKIVNWLQENDIIEKDKTKCLLGLDDLGYKPSTNYLKAVEYDNEIRNYVTCGLEILTSKEVFNRMSFTTATKVFCPICNDNRFEDNTEADFYMELVPKETLDLYYEFQDGFENWINDKETKIKCHKCESISLVQNYIFEPKLYFSNLGFYFWNWPEFKSEFISEFENKIGCKINYNTEKL